MNGIVFQGLVATVAGMGIVFVTLLIISAVLNQMENVKKIFEPKKSEEIIKVEEIEEVEETNINDDLELVAVITAAIATSLNTSNDKLQVRTIRRVNKTKSAWNESGRKERIQSSLY